MTWRTMDSAPKDGTVVDLWVGGHRLADCFYGPPHHECISQYCDSCPDDLNVKAWRWTMFSERVTPSHWMPIPAAPVQPDN